MVDPFIAASQGLRAVSAVTQALKPGVAPVVAERLDRSERFAVYSELVRSATTAAGHASEMRVLRRLPWHQHLFGRWDPAVIRASNETAASSAALIAAFHRVNMIASDRVMESSKFVVDAVADLSDFVQSDDEKAFSKAQFAFGRELREFAYRVRVELKVDRPEWKWYTFWRYFSRVRKWDKVRKKETLQRLSAFRLSAGTEVVRAAKAPPRETRRPRG